MILKSPKTYSTDMDTTNEKLRQECSEDGWEQAIKYKSNKATR